MDNFKPQVYIEPISEYDVDYYDFNGNEIQEPVPTPYEETMHAVSRIDFGITLGASEECTAPDCATNDEETATLNGKTDKNKSAQDEDIANTNGCVPQQKNWNLLRENIFNAQSELCALIDLLKMAKEATYIKRQPVPPPDPIDNLTFAVVSGKKFSLTAASLILQNAHKTLTNQISSLTLHSQNSCLSSSESATNIVGDLAGGAATSGAVGLRNPAQSIGMERSNFLHSLMRLRRKYRLKWHPHNIIGDLGFSSVGSLSAELSYFEISEECSNSSQSNLVASPAVAITPTGNPKKNSPLLSASKIAPNLKLNLMANQEGEARLSIGFGGDQSEISCLRDLIEQRRGIPEDNHNNTTNNNNNRENEHDDDAMADSVDNDGLIELSADQIGGCNHLPSAGAASSATSSSSLSVDAFSVTNRLIRAQKLLLLQEIFTTLLQETRLVSQASVETTFPAFLISVHRHNELRIQLSDSSHQLVVRLDILPEPHWFGYEADEDFVSANVLATRRAIQSQFDKLELDSTANECAASSSYCKLIGCGLKLLLRQLIHQKWRNTSQLWRDLGSPITSALAGPAWLTHRASQQLRTAGDFEASGDAQPPPLGSNTLLLLPTLRNVALQQQLRRRVLEALDQLCARSLQPRLCVFTGGCATPLFCQLDLVVCADVSGSSVPPSFSAPPLRLFKVNVLEGRRIELHSAISAHQSVQFEPDQSGALCRFVERQIVANHALRAAQLVLHKHDWTRLYNEQLITTLQEQQQEPIRILRESDVLGETDKVGHTRVYYESPAANQSAAKAGERSANSSWILEICVGKGSTSELWVSIVRPVRRHVDLAGFPSRYPLECLEMLLCVLSVTRCC